MPQKTALLDQFWCEANLAIVFFFALIAEPLLSLWKLSAKYLSAANVMMT